jgi:hypothetical protein
VADNAINIKQLLKEAALEALREHQKAERDTVRRTRFHNTRLLMDHYLELVEHYENIKASASEVQDEFDEDLTFDSINMDDIIINAIKRTKIRTRVMIRQIETVVAALKADMEAKGEPEKFDVIELLYMDTSKKDTKFANRVDMVADEINCSPGTVRRWNNEMLDKLAIKLFGVDGLRLDI